LQFERAALRSIHEGVVVDPDGNILRFGSPID
jgi:hypothetical protein